MMRITHIMRMGRGLGLGIPTIRCHSRTLTVRSSIGSSFRVPLSVKNSGGVPYSIPRQASTSNGTVINLT